MLFCTLIKLECKVHNDLSQHIPCKLAGYAVNMYGLNRDLFMVCTKSFGWFCLH